MEIKNYFYAFFFGIVLILLLPAFIQILNVGLPYADTVLSGLSFLLLILFFFVLIAKILKFI